MSFGGGFFGGGETKKSYTTETKTGRAMDQRLAVEGGLGGGTLIGPEAMVGGPGAVTTKAGDFSSITQTITGNKYRLGMSGQEVKSMLGEQSSLWGQQLGKVTDFGTAALNALASGTATSGTLAGWKDLAPLILVAVIGVVAFKSRRH